MTDQENKGPIAVVTGGAGDIGRAIARALCATHRIALVDINEPALRKAQVELGDAGRDVRSFRIDLTSPADLAQLASELAAWGKTRVLVNNAGRAMVTSLQSMTNDDLQIDLDLNLKAALSCFKALEHDLKDNGCVINVASVNGMGAFGHPVYSAAKAGLIHATQMMAVEYGKFGMRANAIAPGTVRTQAWEDRAAKNPNVFDDALAWYPLKHLPTPDDIAQAVVFLTSPHARSITGVCLPIDCGLSAGSPSLPRTFTQSADY